MRLLLLTLAVILVLAGVFWLLQDEAGGPAEPELAPLGGAVVDDAPVRLDDVGLRPAAPSVHALAPVPDGGLVSPTPEQLAAAALAPSARVSGQLRDEAGRPIAGEQLDLFVAGDRWDPTAAWPAPDDAPGATPLSRARSDADGRFGLAARPGATHVLRAGGRMHPRTTVRDVHAGDELTLTLEPPRELLGTIVEAETGLPAAGAYVSARGEHVHLLARADADGRFVLAPLPAEALGVAAWTPGREIAVAQEQVPGFDEPVLELVAGRPVPGHVIDRETELPVAGAEVTYVLDTDGHDLAVADPLQTELRVFELTATSDESGAFLIEDGVSWGFRLEVSAEGYVPEVVDRHRLEPLREGHEVLVKLRPERPLLVDVTAGGAAASGANTWVRDTGGAQLAQALADAEGHAELELSDWDGERKLWLHGSDAEGRRGRRFVGKGDDEAVALALRAPFALSVRVEREGAPAPGAQVGVLGSRGSVWLASAGADGVAAFELPVLSDGPETLWLQARSGSEQCLATKALLAVDESDDRAHLFVDDELLPDGEPVTLQLDGGAWISGQVVDSWGEPVPGARLASHGHADGAGRFRVGPLEERDHKLLVFAEGHRKGRMDSPAPAEDVLVVLEPVIAWEGRVLDAASGRPPERFEGLLEREVWSDEGVAWRPTKSRLTRSPVPGEFAVDLPEAGRYRVRVLVPDHLPAFSDVVDFDGMNPPPFADVVSSPAAVLEVLVLDTFGEPVPGVELTLAAWARTRTDERPTGRNTRGATRRRSDDDGEARFDLGEGGSYRLASRRAWLLPGRIDVLPGPPRRQELRVGATGSLLVRVLDETGLQRPAKISVKGARDNPLAVRRSVRSDPLAQPEGARLERLPPGAYELSVSLRDYHAPSQPVLVTPGRTTHVDVHALPGDAPRKPRGEPSAQGVTPKALKKQAKQDAKQAAKGKGRGSGKGKGK